MGLSHYSSYIPKWLNIFSGKKQRPIYQYIYIERCLRLEFQNLNSCFSLSLSLSLYIYIYIYLSLSLSLSKLRTIFWSLSHTHSYEKKIFVHYHQRWFNKDRHSRPISSKAPIQNLIHPGSETGIARALRWIPCVPLACLGDAAKKFCI